MTVVDDVITDLFLWLNLTLSYDYWPINPIKGVGMSVEIRATTFRPLWQHERQ